MNPNGTTDVNLRSFYGAVDDGTLLEERGSTSGGPDGGYTCPLKFTSRVTGIRAQFGTVLGGSENAVDCNNGASDLHLDAEVWDISRTKYGMTNKGGCRGNHFSGIVRGHGKETDFDQDNWSDQSHGPCTETVLALISEDGSPLLVRYIYEKPTLVNGTGPYRFIFPWPWLPLPRSWIGKIFNQMRRVGLFR